ncbi:aromatic ring-hydroxylating oxygenase subunit alpha [Priestia flexa]|uniref:aromatic ring-hydroxylating oxygenase subunit alpha n=1 Tax=Priestia flexa TaxID=86664 RepID=UPI001B338C1B|nr:aromatic ring-hydroxylating dioxygenase subunit alpha [Priestia flexa]
MKQNIDRVFPYEWYAICYSSNVSEKPVKRKIVGKDVVLFRNEKGHISAVHPYCPHRGADLSLGSVVNGKLTCPYHGWQFEGDGTCACIPSQPDQTVPKFAHARSYPVQEKAGLVWIFPDHTKTEKEVKELTIFEEINQDGYKLVPFQSLWKAHFTRTVESILDIAHLTYVHKKTIGKNMPSVVPDYKVEGNLDFFSFSGGGAYLEYMFPHQWILKSKDKEKQSFFQYLTFTPLDEEETLILGYGGRSFLKRAPFIDFFMRYYNLKVLKEDQDVVESQHPRPIPEALKMEAHVQADMAQIQFRKRWFQFLSTEEPGFALDEQFEKNGKI